MQSQSSKKTFFKRWPLLLFILLLVVLFILLVAGKIYRAPEEQLERELLRKQVDTLLISEIDPFFVLSGKVDKNSSVVLTAPTSGIVHNIYVKEGQELQENQKILYLSDTYQGASLASVDLEISRSTQDLQAEVFEKNESIIDDQRDLIKKTDGLSEEIARKQLTLQKRSIDLERSVTALNEKKASVAASLAWPRTPEAGFVDKVFVDKGEFVTAGTPLLALATETDHMTFEVLVPFSLMQKLSVDMPSRIRFGSGSAYEAFPLYISREATSNQSYSVVYEIALDQKDQLNDGSILEVHIPLEKQSQGVFAPLDAVQILDEGAYVFLLEEGENVISREVVLGEVYGSFVLVQEGITSEDEIILNRSVFAGESVQRREQ